MDSPSDSRNPNFPILKVVQNYIKTTQKGCNHWAICPFHKDTSPSMSISTEKNIFKCFACEAAGDAVSFVMKIEKCKYATAILKIGSILGIDVRKYLNARDSLNTKIIKINEIAAFAYHKALFNESNRDKLAYLTKERGLTEETIEKYKIGYAPETDVLTPVLKVKQTQTKEFSEVEIRKSNLYQISLSGELTPIFKDRFIFPIFNRENQIIAFSGRGDYPKYLNIKTNEVFSKRNSIFNIQSLKPNLPIYVFEGFIDLLKSEQIGVGNGVACMGGTIDSSLFRIFKEYSNTIYLCLDNDEAGIKFTNNLSSSLIEQGFKVYIADITISEHKDIDELISADPEKAKNILQNPICYFDWIYSKTNPKNLEEMQLLVNRCLNILFLNNYLRMHINKEYAKISTKKIYSWYKNIDEYESLNLSKTIDEELDIKLREIQKSILTTKETHDLIPNKSISANLPFSSISDPFIKVIIKYSHLPIYYSEYKNEIDGEGNWIIDIPEEEIVCIPEFKSLISSLKNSQISEDIKNLNNSYVNHSIKILSIADFFNKYLSFLINYLDLTISFIGNDKNIAGENRFMRISNIRKIKKEVLEKASSFFKKSSFFGKQEPKTKEQNSSDLSWLVLE